MKYYPIWYDNETSIIDSPIDADSTEEATRLLYLRYEGNPPAKCLSLSNTPPKM